MGKWTRDELQRAHDIIGRDRLFGRAVDFHSVTRCQQKRFPASGSGPQRLLRGAGKALTRLHVRGVMADADAKQVHHVGRVWETKLMAHRTEMAALNARMQSAAIRFGASRCKCRPCRITA